MANGCPVAVTDVGGNGEHVTHGVHGLLSPRRDVQKLSENLSTLLINHELSLNMATNARLRVKRDFQLQTAIDRYKSLYELLSGHSPGSQFAGN